MLSSYDVLCFFYNPNIHPSTEYKKRLTSFCEYAKNENIPYVISRYEMEKYIKEVADKKEERCRECYRLRLTETALYAKEKGYKFFTTTLLSSPHQAHILIKEVAEEVQKRVGVEFIYKDFRPYFKEAIESAKNAGFYIQKYCGCIWSEKKRFYDGAKGKN